MWGVDRVIALYPSCRKYEKELRRLIPQPTVTIIAPGTSIFTTVTETHTSTVLAPTTIHGTRPDPSDVETESPNASQTSQKSPGDENAHTPSSEPSATPTLRSPEESQSATTSQGTSSSTIEASSPGVDTPAAALGVSRVVVTVFQTHNADILASPTSTGGDDTTDSSASPSAASSKPNTGAIVGGVLGALAVVILLVLALFLYIRRRRKQRLAPSTQFMQRYGTPGPFSPASPVPAHYRDEQIPEYTQGNHRLPFRDKA